MYERQELDHLAAAEVFARAARHFCGVVEDDLPDDRAAFIVNARSALAALIVAALELPLVGPDDDAPDVANVDAEQAATRALYKRLRDYLAERNAYWQVWDPYDFADPIQGSLADDLADVAHDMRVGLRHLDEGYHDTALWHWRLMYWFHSSRHAVDALRVLSQFAPPEDATVYVEAWLSRAATVDELVGVLPERWDRLPSGEAVMNGGAWHILVSPTRLADPEEDAISALPQELVRDRPFCVEVTLEPSDAPPSAHALLVDVLRRVVDAFDGVAPHPDSLEPMTRGRGTASAIQTKP